MFKRNLEMNKKAFHHFFALSPTVAGIALTATVAATKFFNQINDLGVYTETLRKE